MFVVLQKKNWWRHVGSILVSFFLNEIYLYFVVHMDWVNNHQNNFCQIVLYLRIPKEKPTQNQSHEVKANMANDLCWDKRC